MPRRPRMYLPDIPVHVVQKGHNGMPCFFQPNDYANYKTFLEQGLERYDVRLHAYVLMTNHVHLLMTPADTAGISRVMQHVGRCYVGYVNWRYERSGTLWEGRHKGSLVQTDACLLNVFRYIELNPVRGGLVDHPAQYTWSSFHANAGSNNDPMVTPHFIFDAWGKERQAQIDAYRQLFDQDLSEETLEEIRVASQYNFPLGNDRFRAQIEAVLGRSIGYRCHGRPPWLPAEVPPEE